MPPALHRKAGESDRNYCEGHGLIDMLQRQCPKCQHGQVRPNPYAARHHCKLGLRHTISDPIIEIPETLSPMTARKMQVYTSDVWSLLPPHEELIQGCRIFVTTCIQIGFTPRALFLEQLENDRRSVNVFLLVSMLAISARFTPALCKRFGGSSQASEFFAEIAHTMIADEMWETCLENAQAFFLLGMADWGKGDRARSSINMGIAVRMAGVLRLHREETYSLPPDASPTDVVDAERARRTFWVIQNHDNLYTQKHLPASFAKSDITTLLPSSEDDFAFGRVPQVRAALAGTKPAQQDPSLVLIPSRSLFATLVQAHDFWGTIARDFSQDENANTSVEMQPWVPDSRYRKVTESLNQWEQNMPVEHRWSAWNLRGFKAQHVELAYLSIVSIMKLNHVVPRRLYLESIVAKVLGHRANDNAPQGFWEQMSFELFSNVWQLYEIIDAFFTTRSSDDGFPAMLAFCVYICGSLASYLVRWPQLCRELSVSASTTLDRALEILSTLEEKWPTVHDWTLVLRKLSEQPASRESEALRDITSQESFLNSAATSKTPRMTPRAVPRTSLERMHECRTTNSGAPARTSIDNHPQHHHSVPIADRQSPMRPVEPFDHQQPPPRPQAPAPTNFLDLLSDAAALGSDRPRPQPAESSYYSQRQAVEPIRRSVTEEPAQQPQASGSRQQFTLPDFSTFEMLHDSFDNDMADFVHGYVHMGWGDWQV
ncbi:hypothetical protein PV08_00231 [Exophiala spinifera]|uniref:Xylanolytic transcriptional activator regulatory domain-containing protein n=1 Tax=Exophiala spinifera TaxID=91928 RepID=A0A0D2A487_9EURO|nr:uncharacterized protein PV08_00231 [Exophiala spinifera]KIW19657.1 hypothetical protein PV08_00231 [Exophiala spinifera]